MTRSDTNIDFLMLKNEIKNDYELAQKMNLSPAALSTRLKGNISLDTLGKAATVFGVTIKELIKD